MTGEPVPLTDVEFSTDLLPINIEELVHARAVESCRIEYKVALDERTKPQVVATIAAFANDLQNLNGGYIILGVGAADGIPTLPPDGILDHEVEKTCRDVRVACKKIDPEFQPLIVPALYEGRHVIVLWVPAGDNRPYRAPDPRDQNERAMFVRLGPETVKAKGEVERQLIEQTARIPFDDRRAPNASILDLSPILVKRFLQEVGSGILDLQPTPKDVDLYSSLRIVTDIHGAPAPRNVGLLFFNERPDRFFSGCSFDVVQFADDAGGNLIEEKRFSGPIDSQVTAVLDYLDTLTNVQLRKIPGRAAVERTVAFPYEALEESIANAAYHRGYENPEPNKVYLYPDRLEIISYPGPVPGITLNQLSGEAPIPPVPARNRRIGEFLKELKLAEMRGTGIPKIRRSMSQNGSSAPTIDFDPDRTYFRVILPAHPRYQALHAIREGSYLWSIGERRPAVERLRNVFIQQPGNGAVAALLIEYLSELEENGAADKVLEEFGATPLKSDSEQPFLRMFKIRFGRQDRAGAKRAIDALPESGYLNSPLDVAICYKRIRDNERAHTILSRIFPVYDNNPDYLHNYAQVKMAIAGEMVHKRNPQWITIRRLRREAIELLRRAITVSTDRVQRAWCYFDLARTLGYTRAPGEQIREAFENAIDLLPSEAAFREAFDRWRAQSRYRY